MFVFHYVSNVLIFFSSLFFITALQGGPRAKFCAEHASICFTTSWHPLWNSGTVPLADCCPITEQLFFTSELFQSTPWVQSGILCGCRQSTPLPEERSQTGWTTSSRMDRCMVMDMEADPLQPYQQPQQAHGQQIVAPPVPSPGRGMPLMPPGHMRSPSPRHMAPHGQPVVTTMQNFPRNADRNGDSGNSRLPHPQQVGAQAQLPSPMQPPPHPSEQPLMPSQQSANRNRLPPTPLQDRRASGDYQGTISPNTPPARTMDHANSPAPVTCTGVSTPAGNKLTSQSSKDSPLCTPTSGIPKGGRGFHPSPL